jgi:hypothetical protein
MIQCLGKIDIPQSLIDDVKNREPDRIACQLDSGSHLQNLQELDPSLYNLSGYNYYHRESVLLKEYTNDWYLEIMPSNFLNQHQLANPKNAVVLRVDPGSFTRPHLDTFKNSLLKKHSDLKIDDIVRLWIPLEDSTFGQALFVGEQMLYKYSAGEVYTFDNYSFHSAANAGLDIRYTLLVYTTKIK